jgi:hypothetical protein
MASVRQSRPPIDQRTLHVGATCKRNSIFLHVKTNVRKKLSVPFTRSSVLKASYTILDLPPSGVEETSAVLRALAQAHRHLAELKGRAAAIPNQGILIDTLALQEAKASSEIENIVTTQDELFQASAFPENRHLPPPRRSRATPTLCARGSWNNSGWADC